MPATAFTGGPDADADPVCLDDAEPDTEAAAEVEPDADDEDEEYPWTLKPATRFSGALDPRPPASIPCWTSKTQIMAAIEAALATEEGTRIRRSEGCRKDGTGGGIALGTVLAVARADCDAADGSTGRNIKTAHETVSRRLSHKGLKISAGSVRKARRVLRRLGFQAVVEEGRYLTKTERLELSIEHAGRNAARARAKKKPFVPWRRASTRVFTMSREIVMSTLEKTGHPPRRGSVLSPLQSQRLTKKRSRAASKTQPGAPKAELNPAPKPRKRKKPCLDAAPRPLAMQRIAAVVKQALPWLSKAGHLNRITDALIEAGVDPLFWTGRRLVRALNDKSTQRGWLMPVTIENPVGYFKHLLKDLNPAEAALEYYRPSRAVEAAASAEAARAALERRRTPEQLAQQKSGLQLVKDALVEARRKAAGLLVHA